MDVDKPALLLMGALVIGATVIMLLAPQIVNFLVRREGLAKEYCERFFNPQRERATALGIPDDEFDMMWKAALKHADPHIIGQAPCSLLRNLIDNWEVDRAGLVEWLREYLT
jgi:hypothetical protein